MTDLNNKRFKKLIQPQEIIVWYILPAIRRELTHILIHEYKLPQSEIAKRFNLTQSTICQYEKGIRGNIDFGFEVKRAIKKAAHNIVKEKSVPAREVQRLIQFIQKKGFLCQFHKKYGYVNEPCKIRCKEMLGLDIKDYTENNY